MSTSISSSIRALKNAILDSLFPVFCLSCQKEGFWLCKGCTEQIQILNFQFCPACELVITEKGFLCPACRENRKSHLDCLIVSVSYEELAMKKLVHNFKYRFIADISLPLSQMMTRALLRSDIPVPDFLSPVPLHPRRLRWRGFNQSLLLSTQISEELAPPMKIEILNILERRKFNRPQMGIKNYQERLQNVKEIFAVRADVDLSLMNDKTILLVDDIATTGATLEECAKVLKLAGAKKVFAVVVARQKTKE